MEYIHIQHNKEFDRNPTDTAATLKSMDWLKTTRGDGFAVRGEMPKAIKLQPNPMLTSRSVNGPSRQF